MGIRFSVCVPTRTCPGAGMEAILGGSVKLRDYARPLLKEVLELTVDEYGNEYGDVTDLQKFSDIVNAQCDGVDQMEDNSTELYFYWSHLAELAKVALAFQYNKVPVSIALM